MSKSNGDPRYGTKNGNCSLGEFGAGSGNGEGVAAVGGGT